MSDVTSTIRISVDAPALVHGVGLFETMRVVDREALCAVSHYERMRDSAAALGFPMPAYTQFAFAAGNAAAKAKTAEAAVRCSWLADRDAWLMSSTCGPIPAVTLRRRRRGRVVTLGADLSRSLPLHKLTSYAVCVVGLQRAIAAGADEGLFVDARGRILEGTSTNVFAIDGDTLITPPVSAGILPGVTRASVIDTARSLGLRVVERTLTRDDLLRGSFLTGSLTTIAPVRELDGAGCDEPPRGLIQRLRVA